MARIMVVADDGVSVLAEWSVGEGKDLTVADLGTADNQNLLCADIAEAIAEHEGE